MKKNIIPVILIAVIFSLNTCFSQIKDSNFNKIQLTDKIINQDTKLTLNDNINKIERIQTDSSNPKEKSVLLGAGMSLLIPGAGELYAKSYLKSAIFLIIEAGLWTTYAIYNGKGNSKTTDYENYANSHWDMRKYGQWLKDQGFPQSTGINPNEQNLEVLRSEINQCEDVNFSHSLPEPGEQQYYEVIGKYQNFIYGWSTAGTDITKNNYETYRLPEVIGYMGDRQLANDFFDDSHYALDIVVINHLISAADAAWSVSVFNKNLNVNTNLNFRNVYSYAQNRYILTPFANIKVTF